MYIQSPIYSAMDGTLRSERGEKIFQGATRMWHDAFWEGWTEVQSWVHLGYVLAPLVAHTDVGGLKEVIYEAIDFDRTFRP